MKRGKRFLEKDNWLIYIGTAIFFILAIALGIIMYMTSDTGLKLKNQVSQIEQEKKGQQIQEQEKIESASTEMGKTVEEQLNENLENTTIEDSYSTSTEESNEVNTTAGEIKNEAETESTSEESQSSSSASKEVEQVDEPDTTTNAPTNASTENEQVSETKKEITFAKPTEGEIICEFAKDNLVYSETLKEWITHTAIDIKADKTSVIKSAADGIVKSIVNDPRYGLTIVIEHDEGYETVYSNLLTAEFVVEGEEVSQGQTIGTAGTTAAFESEMECHLHFELLKDGEYLDPTIYLK